MALFSTPHTVGPRELRRARRDALVADVQSGRVGRVLAVRFGRLGDVLFTTPALSRLAEALPAVRIDYLTRGACRALVEEHPAVTEVLRFEPGWHRPGQLGQRRELRREIAARGYDLVLVFESDHPTRFWLEKLCREAGVRHVVSRSSFVQDADAPPAPHSCERHMALLSMLGLAPDARSYELRVSEAERARAAEFLAQHGAEGDTPLVGIQAGSHYSMWPGAKLLPGLRHKFHKMWPEARWRELGQLLCDRLEARLVLFGAGHERRMAAATAAAIRSPAARRPIVAAGDTDIPLLAALLERMDLLVSVDTGTMHMSAALGVPTLALFGPTNPAHHGPYRRDATCVTLRSGVACSPCNKSVRKRCRANVCMSELSAEGVARAAGSLLARAAAGGSAALA